MSLGESPYPPSASPDGTIAEHAFRGRTPRRESDVASVDSTLGSATGKPLRCVLRDRGSLP